MDPLLGLLGASVVAAIAGTALKGIVRPLSWALLTGVTLLFGSSKVVDATNALGQAPVLTSDPTSTVASNAATGVAPVAQGWQSAASGLDPALSPLYGQVGQGQVGQGQPNQPAPNQSAPNLTLPQGSATPLSPPDRVSSARPIVGLW
ncbi:MAG: hypothetical protein HC772_16885 [Leptolyngbyaceae cyanobacterium CRU_2_3]|nr:hypothetical protein [Leptolyngbyaceae cyanobacterium CRU_2_3]